QVNITYLYFNGASPTEENKSLKMANVPDAKKAVQFSLKDIPAINFACQECWVNGLLLGNIEGAIQPRDGALLLTAGKLKNSSGELSVSGVWSEDSLGNSIT
ncbi:hypothetical protein QP358_08715, partial [Nosocomiicoccus ampullae]